MGVCTRVNFSAATKLKKKQTKLKKEKIQWEGKNIFPFFSFLFFLAPMADYIRLYYFFLFFSFLYFLYFLLLNRHFDSFFYCHLHTHPQNNTSKRRKEYRSIVFWPQVQCFFNFPIFNTFFFFFSLLFFFCLIILFGNRPFSSRVSPVFHEHIPSSSSPCGASSCKNFEVDEQSIYSFILFNHFLDQHVFHVAVLGFSHCYVSLYYNLYYLFLFYNN